MKACPWQWFRLIMKAYTHTEKEVKVCLFRDKIDSRAVLLDYCQFRYWCWCWQSALNQSSCWLSLFDVLGLPLWGLPVWTVIPAAFKPFKSQQTDNSDNRQTKNWRNVNNEKCLKRRVKRKKAKWCKFWTNSIKVFKKHKDKNECVSLKSRKCVQPVWAGWVRKLANKMLGRVTGGMQLVADTDSWQKFCKMKERNGKRGDGRECFFSLCGLFVALYTIVSEAEKQCKEKEKYSCGVIKKTANGCLCANGWGRQLAPIDWLNYCCSCTQTNHFLDVMKISFSTQFFWEKRFFSQISLRHFHISVRKN